MGKSISEEAIENKILLIRGQKVMLDRDLAKLYAVTTKRLNEQVKRNIKRFPPDFMFRLTWEEGRSSRSQNATLNDSNNLHNERGGNIKYLPYAFTEHGVAMLSSILSSERAIQVNIFIVRTFVRLRKILSTHKDIALKLSALERKIDRHDIEIQSVFEAIRQLMAPPPEPPKRRISFRPTSN